MESLSTLPTAQHTPSSSHRSTPYPNRSHILIEDRFSETQKVNDVVSNTQDDRILDLSNVSALVTQHASALSSDLFQLLSQQHSQNQYHKNHLQTKHDSEVKELLQKQNEMEQELEAKEQETLQWENHSYEMYNSLIGNHLRMKKVFGKWLRLIEKRKGEKWRKERNRNTLIQMKMADRFYRKNRMHKVLQHWSLFVFHQRTDQNDDELYFPLEDLKKPLVDVFPEIAKSHPHISQQLTLEEALNDKTLPASLHQSIQQLQKSKSQSLKALNGDDSLPVKKIYKSKFQIRKEKLDAERERQWTLREQDMMEKIHLLELEKERWKEKEKMAMERIKQAVMRGICALNLETMGVFDGQQQQELLKMLFAEDTHPQKENNEPVKMTGHDQKPPIDRSVIDIMKRSSSPRRKTPASVYISENSGMPLSTFEVLEQSFTAVEEPFERRGNFYPNPQRIQHHSPVPPQPNYQRQNPTSKRSSIQSEETRSRHQSEEHRRPESFCHVPLGKQVRPPAHRIEKGPTGSSWVTIREQDIKQKPRFRK